MKSYLLILCILMSGATFAQVGAPVQVDANTLALWKFDNDSGDSVVDESSNNLDGTNFGSVLEAIPDLDVGYSLGRKFTASNQLIEFGDTIGSPLDFENA